MSSWIRCYTRLGVGQSWKQIFNWHCLSNLATNSSRTHCRGHSWEHVVITKLINASFLDQQAYYRLMSGSTLNNP
jgi:hypothetical protein